MAFVVEPLPMNIEEVRVSETKASVKAVPFHIPVVMVPVLSIVNTSTPEAEAVKIS